MSKTTLDDLFENHKGEFDINEPTDGHQARFHQKLNTDEITLKSKSSKPFWKPFLAIAASITLLISIYVFMPQEYTVPDLASISPEMAQTETIFTTALTSELNKLNSEETPEYQEIIVETLFQIKVLEEDYNQLIYGLKENPKSELILSAMILNFQSRIDVIQDVMHQIEVIKELNNNTTII
jgi:hypothetical protein